ncbi:hypothetical protein GvMRE_IIg436 [endosymbiont GvMRE of Glomus versiforme]|nr:hypothetical protein GvMRE_IIg436 [endosymbiont GvMRE of Glomus versiforme]
MTHSLLLQSTKSNNIELLNVLNCSILRFLTRITSRTEKQQYWAN